MKRLLSIVLSLSLTASVIVFPVHAEMTEYSGSWEAATGAANEYISVSDDIVTLSVPNMADDGKGTGKVKWKAENRTEIDYVLDSSAEAGLINISYEFKANSSLGAAARAAEIRFTDVADSGADYIMSVTNAVSQPYIFKGPSEIERFSTNALSAGTGEGDAWHTAEYVFYADGESLTAIRAVIDGEDVNGEFSYTQDADIDSLKAIEFWFFGNSTNTADYELKIRNMKVVSGVEDITVTSEMADGSDDVREKSFDFGFSHAVTESVKDALSVMTSDGAVLPADKYNVSLSEDYMGITVNINATEYDSGKTFVIKLDKGIVEGQKGEKLAEDFLFTFTFGEIEPVPRLVVKSNIEDGATGVVPSLMKFTFESQNGADFEILPDSFDASEIRLYDGRGSEVSGLSAVLKNKTIIADAAMCTENTEYTIVIGKNAVKGMAGEYMENDFSVSFTTFGKRVVTGSWSKTYNKHTTDFVNDGEVIKINVTNDGTVGAQNTRDAYTYAFDEPVTGKNVPVRISYKFKANEALSASESHVRFYPYEHGDRGGGNICLDFSYTNPQFRWDNIRLDLPEGMTALSPDEWHEAEFIIVADETAGLTMIKAVTDGAVTGLSYNKSAPKQLGCVDFWFYPNAENTGDYELLIKDFLVVKGADIIDVESEIENGSTDVDAKNMKISFSQPVIFTGDVKEAINIVDESNSVISPDKYTVVMNDDNTVASVTMNTDDLDSRKTYKIHIDNTKLHGKLYEVIKDEFFISFTLPEIKPKATLGILPAIPAGSTDVNPADMKFDIIPVANDRISDVAGYEISVATGTDIANSIVIYNVDESVATDVLVTATLSSDNKVITLTLDNYDRYKKYIIRFLRSQIIGENGELMAEDYAYTFTTGEIDRPPYVEHNKEFKISWHGKTTYSTDDKTGITTFVYKNSEANGSNSERTEMGWYLEEPITNSEGPVIVSYDFQFNDALKNTVNGDGMNAYVANANANAALTHRRVARVGDMTDWSTYIIPSTETELSSGVTDEDAWHTIKYIMNVDNGKITHSYVQLDDALPVDISPLKVSVNNIGLLQFRFYSYPDEEGVYRDYILRVKNVSVKSLGALKGEVKVNSPESIGLRFSYEVPVMFGNDITISELRDGKYEPIKQSYKVEEMNPSDMKQVNITIGDGGLCYNTDYRITVTRTGIVADEFVKLKQTDIDFKTQEYPDNVKTEISGVSEQDGNLSFNCMVTNISRSDVMKGAYVIAAAYNERGEMLNKYAQVLPDITAGQECVLNVSLAAASEATRIRVFIFEDDKSFKLYHHPQSFTVY